MSENATPATPAVRADARRLGVDLATVAGTGVSGRITRSDVRAAAAAAAPAARATSAPHLRLASPPSPRATKERSAWSSARVLVDPYARNPLVDDARQAIPTVYRAAVADGPPPSLFAAGDLPIFIASGAEPALLLQLPWQVRHQAAAADAAQLASLLERYAGVSGTTAAAYDHGEHPENRAYTARVREWLHGNTPAARARREQEQSARKAAQQVARKSRLRR